MNFDTITLSSAWTWLLSIAAALVALAKAWEIVSRMLHPESDLREKVTKHQEMLENDNRRIKNLEKQLESDEEFDGVMCTVMFALLNHMLSGNDVDKLKSARDELQNYMSKSRR